MSDYGNFRRHMGAVPFELVMAGGAVVTFSQGNWKHFAASVFTLLVSFLPLLLECWWKLRLPAFLQITYVAFIFATLFTGEVLHMYARLWWWDDTMHFLSSLLIGFGAMLWLLILEKRGKNFHIPAWFGALFIVGISIMVVVLWELVEFGSDEIFGTFSQGASLFDTMMDMAYESTSAALMGLLWLVHRKSQKVPLLSPLIKRFERANR